ncbi:MAG: hypothetical protein J6K40_03430 [Alistipes sp.]|nr:hypothetical protein [Alistipes sp.]
MIEKSSVFFLCNRRRGWGENILVADLWSAGYALGYIRFALGISFFYPECALAHGSTQSYPEWVQPTALPTA